MANALDASTSTPHRDAIPTQRLSNTSSMEPTQPVLLGDSASRAPYRCADLDYYRQLVHFAHKQLPTFQEIDVNILLNLCLQTKARIVPRETQLLWHQIFSDEVACEYCTTVQACSFCFECNKILCPGCTHTVSNKGARCFDCTQIMVNDSNHRLRPSTNPRLQTVLLKPKH